MRRRFDARVAMAAWIVLVLALLPGATRAGANPVLIYGPVQVHVQSVDPGFCSLAAGGYWTSITSTTEQTGELEFDIFFLTVDQPVSLFETFVEWPPEWNYLSDELCVPSGLVLFDGERLNVAAMGNWPADREVLVARILMDAPTPGSFHLTGTHMISESQDLPITARDAFAGITCGTSVRSSCAIEVDSHRLELIATQGQTAVGSVGISGAGVYCLPRGSTDLAWASVAMVDSPEGIRVEVHADAVGLEVGIYEGSLLIETEGCKQCVDLVVIVREQTPVERTSWGGVKQSFR